MARKSTGETAQVVTDLKDRIRKSGRTQASLARASGISDRMVYYLMSGRARSVGADVLTALAASLDCEVRLIRTRRPIL